MPGTGSGPKAPDEMWQRKVLLHPPWSPPAARWCPPPRPPAARRNRRQSRCGWAGPAATHGAWAGMDRLEETAAHCRNVPQPGCGWSMAVADMGGRGCARIRKCGTSTAETSTQRLRYKHRWPRLPSSRGRHAPTPQPGACSVQSNGFSQTETTKPPGAYPVQSNKPWFRPKQQGRPHLLQGV